MSEMDECVETILRFIITECISKLEDRNDVQKMRKVELNIGGEQRCYQNFGLGELINLWRQADVPKLWGKLRDRHTPAIFNAFPFTEFHSARNPSVHHGEVPSPNTVKRFYWSMVELLDEAFPEERPQRVPRGKLEATVGTSDNLPRNDRDFIGRRKEIEQILRLLSRKSRTWLISITGVGGVGKSALAIEAASQCIQQARLPETFDAADLVFDACVWTSAKQKSLAGDEVLDRFSVKSNLESIVSEILRVVVPDHAKNLPNEVKQLEEVLRILAETRILLIVDNMETIEDAQVMAFLKDLPQPSKAIITDRRSVPESHPILLNELSSEESLRLISSFCESRDLPQGNLLTDEQAATLVARTGGIPLAIDWVLGQMSAGLPVDTVLRKLADAGASPVLDFLFAESFNHVSEHSKRILSVLALPGTIVSGQMLANWAGLVKDDAEDALGELVRFALVSEHREPSISSAGATRVATLQRFYKTLPLTREYILARSPYVGDEMRKSISGKVLALVRAKEAEPDWPSIETIDLVDQHHELFAWATEDSFKRGDYLFVVQTLQCIGYALGIHGYHDLRLRIACMSAEAARKLDNHEQLARALIMNQGWVNFVWYKFDEAEQATLAGLDAARLAKNRAMEGHAVRLLGLIAKEKKDFPKAKELLEQARRISSELPDKHLMAITIGSIGSLNRDLKKWELAEHHFREALEVASTVGNNEEIASIMYQKLAKLLASTDRLEEAELVNREALSILGRLKRQQGVAYCKLNLACIAEKRGNLQEALDYANEASTLFFEYGSKEDIATDLERIRKKAAEETNGH